LNGAMLYDMSGKLVRQEKFNQGEQESYYFSVKGLPKGNYNLVLSGKDFNKTHQIAVE
jgi:hypothetical protein